MPTSLQRSLYIARLTASSFLKRARFAAGKIDSDTGSSTASLDVDSSVAYIHRTFEDYVRYGALTGDRLRGAHLLEIGPGDNIGAGLRFLARGAARYATLDKFFSRRDPEHERATYQNLRAALPASEQDLFDRAVTLSPALTFDPDRVQAVYGHEAQKAAAVFPKASFDGILSRAVLHEIYEAEAALQALDQVLKPGGWMVHKVDLRDDGLFSARGYSPLEFLTISGPVYWLMAYDTDKTCRRPLPFYRDVLGRMGYQTRFIITGIVEASGYKAVENPAGEGKEQLTPGVDYGPEHQRMLDSIRPRLSGPFRTVSDSDLLTASVFLTARKPL